MKVRELLIPGVFVLESPVFADDRGFFREWFKDADQRDAGVNFDVRQANLSRSAKNVIRGLHYSVAAAGQAKVVTCVEGSIQECMVDIRLGSPTFGRVEQLTLAAGDGLSVHIASGVAHGFCVTSEFATIAYLLSSPYEPTYELEIDPMDHDVSIGWHLNGPAILSDKDAAAPSLEQRRQSNELPIFQPR